MTGQHRIRLSDDELARIVSALKARMAMRHGQSAVDDQRLIERLEECNPGNPAWRLGWRDPLAEK